jgi:hypothetical protein
MTNMCGVVFAPYARPAALVPSISVAFGAASCARIHFAISSPDLYSPLLVLVELTASQTTSFAPHSFCSACMLPLL